MARCFLPSIQKKVPFTQNEKGDYKGWPTLDKVKLADIVPRIADACIKVKGTNICIMKKCLLLFVMLIAALAVSIWIDRTNDGLPENTLAINKSGGEDSIVYDNPDLR